MWLPHVVRILFDFAKMKVLTDSVVVLLVVFSLVLCVQGFMDPKQSCANTKSAFENISELDSNGNRMGLTGELFNRSMSVSDNKCGLSETCCSRQAELSLMDYIVEVFRDKLLTRLSDHLMGCHNHTFFDEFKAFLESSKTNLTTQMCNNNGMNLTSHHTLFDKFFSYLQSTVDTGDICNIEEEWLDVFYEVYAAIITSSSSKLPPTSPYLYDVFNSTLRSSVLSNLDDFRRTYTHLMHYFRALKTLNMVIESIVDYSWDNNCQLALMKMTYCSSCAGYSNDTATCDGMCLNVLRGCLVELSSLFEPLQEFGNALGRIQKQLEAQNGTFSLLQLLVKFNNNVFQLISNTSSQQVVDPVNCTTENVFNKENPVIEAEVLPFSSLSQSASCITDALALLRTIPEDVCSSVSTSNTSCWNGNTKGSYERAVITFENHLQINNPEVNINLNRSRRFQVEIAYLKGASRDLNIISGYYECDMDDEDENCTVPDTCAFYNITHSIGYNNQYDLEGSSQSSGSGTTQQPVTLTPPTQGATDEPSSVPVAFTNGGGTGSTEPVTVTSGGTTNSSARSDGQIGKSLVLLSIVSLVLFI